MPNTRNSCIGGRAFGTQTLCLLGGALIEAKRTLHQMNRTHHMKSGCTRISVTTKYLI